MLLLRSKGIVRILSLGPSAPKSSFAWKPPTLKDSYDVVVIGGGAGGLSFAKEAATQGLSTALLDYVSPSPRGATWGLGGTCTNVGCVPKKLMHTSGLIRHSLSISPHYGWNLPGSHPDKAVLSWDTLRDNIQGYIKSSNYSTGVKLKEMGIDYVNAKGVLIDPHTIQYRYRNDPKYPQNTVTSKNVVVAIGSRPNMVYDGPGGKKAAEFWVTSDELFTLEQPPGPTLVFGGGYIGVECAGFLRDLGFEVTLLSKSPYLAGFDKDLVSKVMADLKERGVKIIEEAKIEDIAKAGGETEITYSFNAGGGKRKSAKEKYRTLLLAIGRKPQTKQLGVEAARVKVSLSGHILGRTEEMERSVTQDHIYALGDVLHGSPQLMPVAQKAGYLLAKRLAARMKGTMKEEDILKQYSMEYRMIPTTLFTPTECASVGLSEEDAAWRYGYENIEIYHSKFPGLEDYILPKKKMNYVKVITSKKYEERVVGVHYFGAHAGEIITALAVGVKKGITKRDLDFTVGVHPTVCEEFTNLRVKKREKPEFERTAC